MKEYSLSELEKGLNEGEFSSVDLLDMYLSRIYEYDFSGPKINSMAEINPDAYQIARILDEERKNQGPRSKLHGIPVVVKDNILTNDKMHTSAASIVFKDYYGIEDAYIIKKLREAGAIILGKANLSEFAYFMSFDDMPSGYGGRFGQVKSPYSKNIDPLGSSTGSAVAVACNFIPVSIGTETNGSLTAPALMNSVQTLKPTMGLTSRTGIIPISHHQDIAGPLARTVEDLAFLMEYIYGYDELDLPTHLIKDKKIDFLNATKLSVKNTKVGFVKFKNFDYSEEELKIEAKAKDVLKSKGIEIVELKIEAESISNFDTLIYDFKVDLNYFMEKYMKDYKVHSLKDIIEFNKEDPGKRMKFKQSIFEAAENTTGALRDKEYQSKFRDNYKKANLMTKLLEENDLDAIASIKRTQYAPIAGNPVVSVVAKTLIDDTPRSMFFIGRKFSDDLLLSIANVYEQETHKRIAPDLDNIR
ncbi:MAG: amidase family protein [Tenericutes bacterium]|jgi:amidase|nr:amidase family protein [Mycoplasmatota bacterium]